MAETLSDAGARRVALLARPGKAADNLADALRQAGADLVLVADPNTLDEATLLSAQPHAVLVALEPGVEHAVDRLDAVLSSPELTVIFDEADLAAHRAGWDAARWARHLSAKLHHHQQVLPPGGEAETEEWYPSPGQLPKPQAESVEMDFGAFAQEAAVRADAVPADGMHFDAIVQEVAIATQSPAEMVSPPSDAAATESQAHETVPDAQSFDTWSIEANSFDASNDVLDIEPTIERSEAELSHDDRLNTDLSHIEPSQIEAMRLHEDEDMSVADASSVQPMQFDDDAFFLEEFSADVTKPQPAEDVSMFAFDTASRFDDATSSSRVDHFDLDLSDAPLSRDIASAAPTPSSASTPTITAGDSFGELSLVSDDAPVMNAPGLRAGTVSHDLSSFESRISSLSLVDLEPSDVESRTSDIASSMSDFESADAPPTLPPVWEETPLQAADTLVPPPLPASDLSSNLASNVAPNAGFRGVLLIEAGLGGPDPVRQVLAGLPSSFPSPVLVRLHLQGGRYDRLVTQMERAASLPVVLAEVGVTLRGGCIYFLPEGVGLHALSDGMKFIAHPSPAATIFAALPAEDSAILFLSGSDAALIEDAMQAADAGALVVAQSPEDCYDGAACAYLASRGAASGLPPDLARRVLSHWTS